MVLYLKTFGGLSVTAGGASGVGAAQQRKTLALLALLAAAGRRGISRDKLIAYLWPEADSEHARGLLKQACYALRRDLHAPDLLLGATELRLNPAIITSDVQAFEAALEQGHSAEAARIYVGPFLDGFFLSDSPEFEEWVEGERNQLRRLASETLEKLAMEADTRGDHRAAVDSWRRLSLLNPLNSRVTLGLMNALAAAGDRSEALKFAREHESLVREELDAPPETAVVELARHLRAEAGGGAGVGGNGEYRHAAKVIESDAPPVLRPRVIADTWKWAVGLALVTGLGAWIFWQSDGSVPLDRNLVAVAPFDILAPDVEPWREGLAWAVSGYLDGAGSLRTVDPNLVMRQWRGRADGVSAADLGRRTGARFVVYGALLGAGADSVRLTATLLDVAAEKTLAEIAYRDAANHVARLTDSLVAAVLRELGRTHTVGVALVGSRNSVQSISVNVLGPDGRSSICNYLPTRSVVTARLLNATRPSDFGGFAAFSCPEHQLQLSVVTPGIWYLRIELPSTPAIGVLPRLYLETTPVVFGVARDIVIREGSRVGGHATFDGQRVEGVGLNVLYETFGVTAIGGASGLDGRWTDYLGRTPMVVQTGVPYRPSCRYLGAKLVKALPNPLLLLPSRAVSVNCAMVTAPSVRFTHNLTRLVVTPMPGDIGGTSDDLAHELGYGWGVQFPLGADQLPAHDPSASHLFQSGLLIGIAPDQVLSGVDLRGQAACGAHCRDLGLDGNARLVSSSQSFGKHVVWQYSDAGSPEGIGLHVTQQSFDGRLPADYILFQFIITNSASSAPAFHAGFFGDWDIRGDTDDVGFTEMAGRLMYQTKSDASGPYLGTLLISDAPITGNYFFRSNVYLSLSEQVGALAGRISRPNSDAAGDNRYIHGAGPFTLDHNQSAELWIAVVAGETKDQLLASAAAAEADIKIRRQQALGRSAKR